MFKETVIGTVPEEWDIDELSNVSKIVDSLHQTPKYADEGYPMVRVTDIKQGYLSLESCLKVDQDVFEDFTKKYKPQHGDIVISRVGSYGLFSYVKTTNNFCLGQNTTIISPKIDNDYLYYCLLNKTTKEQIEKLVVGSTQKTLSLKNIKSIKIPICSEKEQKSIANILSALDEKIETNNQINKKLEEMAQAIFRQWFVNFEFPNGDEEPYKSSGGEMVESEMGVIPKDWEAKSLGEIADFKYGKMPKKQDIVKEGYPIYSGYKVTGFHKECMFKNSELIVVARGVGGTGDVKLSPPNCYLTNLSIAVLLDNKKEYREFLYYYLRAVNLRQLDTGSAQSQITITNLSNFKIIVPPKDIVGEFHNIINNLLKLVSNNKQQNLTLHQMIDTILPKLISGEIRVPSNN